MKKNILLSLMIFALVAPSSGSAFSIRAMGKKLYTKGKEKIKQGHAMMKDGAKKLGLANELEMLEKRGRAEFDKQLQSITKGQISVKQMNDLYNQIESGKSIEEIAAEKVVTQIQSQLKSQIQTIVPAEKAPEASGGLSDLMNRSVNE